MHVFAAFTGSNSGPIAVAFWKSMYSSSGMSESLGFMNDLRCFFFAAKMSGNVMGAYFFSGPCSRVLARVFAKYAMLYLSPCTVIHM
jgi:hypothetical protein